MPSPNTLEGLERWLALIVYIGVGLLLIALILYTLGSLVIAFRAHCRRHW